MVDGSETNIFNYVYDKIGQLTEVKKNNSAIETYSYDSNGNRLNNNAQYDSQDRLISNSSTFTYTERGTLTSRTENNQTTNYNYDLMGNLLSVTLPNSTEIEYITDARNRRIAKKVNGIVTQKFLYLNQLEPIAELDANDNIVSLFVYGTRSNTPDYIIKNNVKYKVVTNQLGSVVKVVNTTNGTVEQAIEYDSFGNILSDSNPNFQPFTLAGGIYDNDTKLTRFGARDYDAREGRWTSKDPIKFDGGMNFYSYCNGDPVNRIDFDGLRDVDRANAAMRQIQGQQVRWLATLGVGFLVSLYSSAFIAAIIGYEAGAQCSAVYNGFTGEGTFWEEYSSYLSTSDSLSGIMINTSNLLENLHAVDIRDIPFMNDGKYRNFENQLNDLKNSQKNNKNSKYPIIKSLFDNY